MLSAFLAFFLPAALIGLLAMGMVVDQKKIRENEIRNSWIRDIGREARRLEAEIEKQVETVFGQVAAGFTPAADRPALIEALKAIFVENKNVSYPFLFSPDNEMILPGFGNPHTVVRSGWMEKWSPPVPDHFWRQAENIEFSRKDPLRAIPFYLALEERLPRRKLPDLYLAVSRCYFKAGKMIQAREYGLTALRQLEGASLRQDRLDLYVLRQLGLIATRMGLPREAFSYYLRLYETLASRPGELSQDLRFLRWEALDFLKNNRDIQPYLKKERIEEIDSQILELVRGEISLFSDLAAPGPASDPQAADRDRFLKLKEIFDPETSDTLFYRSVEKHFRSLRFSSGDSAVHFVSGVFQQSPYLLAFARIPDRVDGSLFCFGCQFQLQELFSKEWPALRSSLSLPGGTALTLVGPGGKRLPGNEDLAGKTTILAVSGRAPLDRWAFQLHAGNSRLFSSLAGNALRWYYALIALLFISLALGILLLVRYLGREKRLLRQKAEFIDITSHTLKTPLTRLRLLAEKLERGWTVEPGRTRDDCRAIAAETTNMAQMIDRMLAFSALQAGPHAYRFERHDFREWLPGVLRKFELALAEKGFEVQLVIDKKLPPARIDPEAMATALSNLVDNAMQHADAGHHLDVAATANGGNLELSITDHGPGISHRDRERIFEPFFQGSDAQKGKNAGKGLGLAICRQIVEAHGGAIKAKDGPAGKGISFVITLPVAKEARMEVEPCRAS